MKEDPELKAMESVFETMKNLSDDSKLRIVKWLTDKFQLDLKLPNRKGSTDESKVSSYQKNNIESFGSIEDLFSHVDPKDTSDKVLVVASFLQVNHQKPDLTGIEINRALRDLGHGVKNITNAIQSLIDRKPKLMIQTRKTGTTKQAKKKYKVTSEGLKRVREMLQISTEDTNET